MAAGARHARHLGERLADVRDVREDLERADDVERAVGERNRGDAPLADGEPARARLGEHPGREIEALGAARERREALEEEARSAARLEDVFAGAVTRDELDLEIVEHRVVAEGVVRSPRVLVARREIVVVRARRVAVAHQLPYFATRAVARATKASLWKRSKSAHVVSVVVSVTRSRKTLPRR